MGDFTQWGNLGSTAILAGAFIFMLRDYARDKAAMLAIISNHLQTNVAALSKVTDVLDGLVAKVNHIDSDHLDRE